MINFIVTFALNMVMATWCLASQSVSLPDKTILQFPDQTTPAVMEKTAKRVWDENQKKRRGVNSQKVLVFDDKGQRVGGFEGADKPTSTLSKVLGVFGPTDPSECVEKYWPRVGLEDARDVVMRACGVAYGDNDLNDEVKIVSRCILKRSEDMYSFESSLKVINSCTKKYPQFFKYYQDVLMQRAVAMAESQKKQERLDRRLNAPTTLIDMNTGLPRPCQQIGNILHCD